MITIKLFNRYKDDQAFHFLVNVINNSIVKGDFTIDDFREALLVAKELSEEHALRHTGRGQL